MRAVAEYVMRGRTEAIMVSVLATGTILFAWFGAAVLALVTLRHGSRQGSVILLWALLPAIVVAAMGDTGPVTTLLGVMLIATVLRSTTSWSWALIAAVMSGLVTALLMLTIGRGYIEEILRLLGEALAQLDRSQPEGSGSLLQFKPTTMQIAGLLGLSNAFTVVMCLILGRWWQALLYNPGGFREEFHGLRLAPQLTVVLLVAGLALSSLGVDYRLWAATVAIPFVFAGFALMHSLAAKRGIGSNWLVLFYLGWLLFDPLKAIVLVAAIVDSWVDIRRRVSAKHSNDKEH